MNKTAIKNFAIKVYDTGRNLKDNGLFCGGGTFKADLVVNVAIIDKNAICATLTCVLD